LNFGYDESGGMMMDRQQIQMARKIIEERSIPITETGCWIWEGCGTYGRVKYNKQRFYAHRLAYAVYNGKVSKTDTITHTCHNPCCVNPDHLVLVHHTV
jgi:hypothetical protein